MVILVTFILARIISVYRTAHFNSAHRLNVPQWSEEQNKAYFGLCNNAHFHGHNYDLQVKVTGAVDEVTGYLIDMKTLKLYIEEEVVEVFDHKNLNLDVAEFAELNPTAENIAWVIWNKLRNRLDTKFELSIRLYETPRNFVEFNG
jgi:6-pyruvoyltetrahydropterin/6-carboxytetrahydropterin synthase